MERIGPGTLLAGRYRLGQLVHSDDVSALWSAEDVTLDRPVGVRVLSVQDSRVQSTLDAARRAALVDDRRLQRVLGVGLEGGSGFVVLEWVTGQDAAALAGKVSEQEAVRITTEAAEALRTAASRSLHHGRIGPRHVMRSSDGTVRVMGTGIEVALTGPATPAAAARPEARDVRDLAAVLYALVTGHWPFGGLEDVAAAPTERGRPVLASRLRDDVGAPLERLLADTRAGSGADSLDGLVRQLNGTLAAPGPAAGDAHVRGSGPDLDETTDTDVIAPVPAAAAGAGAAAAGAGAAAAGAATAGDPTVGTRPGAPVGQVRPADVRPTAPGPAWTAPPVVREDDGWDLLPVDDEWDEQYAGYQDAPGDGTEWPPAQPWDDQPWDDGEQRRPGPSQDPGGATPVLPGGRGRGRRRPAGAGTGVVVVLLMGAFVVGGLVWALDRFDTDEVAAPEPVASQPVVPSPAPEPSVPVVEPEPTAGVVQVISPAGVQALDPQGDGEENDQDAPNAIDGDPSTAWNTQRYNSQQFGGLKDGIGLVFDLGEPRAVSEVLVDAAGDGGEVEVRAANGPGFDGSTVVATGQTGDDTITLVPDAPVTTQFVLVWFTSLPEVGGEWRGEVAEVQVQVQ